MEDDKLIRIPLPKGQQQILVAAERKAAEAQEIYLSLLRLLVASIELSGPVKIVGIEEDHLVVKEE